MKPSQNAKKGLALAIKDIVAARKEFAAREKQWAKGLALFRDLIYLEELPTWTEKQADRAREVYWTYRNLSGGNAPDLGGRF